jgi:hypothetical protein
MCWGSKKTIAITVADNAPKKPEVAQEDDEVKRLKEKIAKLEAAGAGAKTSDTKKATPLSTAPVPQHTTPAPAPKPAKANADSIL